MKHCPFIYFFNVVTVVLQWLTEIVDSCGIVKYSQLFCLKME